MAMTVLTGLLVLAAAFAVGHAANRGGTCAVAASRQLVTRRSAGLLLGFLLATAIAGLVSLPLAWLTGRGTSLPGSAPIGGMLLIGAVLLGIGASINGACLLGSLWRLGNGEVRLLALPFGLALGTCLANRLGLGVRLAPNPNTAPGSDALPLIGLSLVMALMLFPMLGDADGRPIRRAMVVLGLGGALLYGLAPGWTYAEAVQRVVLPPMMNAGSLLLAATACTVAGAVVSAKQAGSLVLQRPDLAGTARALAGGLLMALGAALVPGGNDKLLLSSVPTGSASAVLAFAMMSSVILLIEAVSHQRRRREPPAARHRSSDSVAPR